MKEYIYSDKLTVKDEQEIEYNYKYALTKAGKIAEEQLNARIIKGLHYINGNTLR